MNAGLSSYSIFIFDHHLCFNLCLLFLSLRCLVSLFSVSVSLFRLNKHKFCVVSHHNLVPLATYFGVSSLLHSHSASNFFTDHFTHNFIFFYGHCIMSTTNASSIWMSKFLLLSAFSLSFDFIVIVSIATYPIKCMEEEEKIEMLLIRCCHTMQHNHRLITCHFAWSHFTRCQMWYEIYTAVYLHGTTSIITALNRRSANFEPFETDRIPDLSGWMNHFAIKMQTLNSKVEQFFSSTYFVIAKYV